MGSNYGTKGTAADVGYGPNDPRRPAPKLHKDGAIYNRGKEVDSPPHEPRGRIAGRGPGGATPVGGALDDAAMASMAKKASGWEDDRVEP